VGGCHIGRSLGRLSQYQKLASVPWPLAPKGSGSIYRSTGGLTADCQTDPCRYFSSTPAHPPCYLSMLLQTGDFINCVAARFSCWLTLETILRSSGNVELTNNIQLHPSIYLLILRIWREFHQIDPDLSR
jgi:hypothetical protein